LISFLPFLPTTRRSLSSSSSTSPFTSFSPSSSSSLLESSPCRRRSSARPIDPHHIEKESSLRLTGRRGSSLTLLLRSVYSSAGAQRASSWVLQSSRVRAFLTPTRCDPVFASEKPEVRACSVLTLVLYGGVEPIERGIITIPVRSLLLSSSSLPISPEKMAHFCIALPPLSHPPDSSSSFKALKSSLGSLPLPSFAPGLDVLPQRRRGYALG
jgi:hypothetical protein